VFIGLIKEKCYPHEGYIDFAATTLTSTTSTLLKRGFLANPKGKILPGLFARVRVPLEKKEAFLVPDAAVSSDQQGSYVLVVDEKNAVERRTVKTGAKVDELRIVEEGLNGKERVVVNGMLKAAPGRQVTPEQENVASTANAQQSSVPAVEKR
jgi:RND family efflux transporter MFP subunit